MKNKSTLILALSLSLSSFFATQTKEPQKKKFSVAKNIARAVGIGILAIPFSYCAKELSYANRGHAYFQLQLDDLRETKYFMELSVQLIGATGSLFGMCILAKDIACDLHQWYKDKKDKEKNQVSNNQEIA